MASAQQDQAGSSDAGGFCEACGEPHRRGARFCSACGAQLAAPANVGESAPAGGEAPGDGAAPRRSRKRLLAVGGLAIVLLALAAAAVIAFGHSSSAPSAAQRQRTALAALRSRVLGPFEVAMQQRTKFFAAERAFLGAMSDANGKLDSYKRRKARVERETEEINNATSAQSNACAQPESVIPCPNPTYPTYPTAPEVQGDVGKLRNAVSRLTSLKAAVLAVTPPPELKVLYAQLESAITMLSANAQSDADTLEQGVSEPEQDQSGSTGSVDEQKIATLQPDQAVPAIKIMNQQAVGLIEQLRLDLSKYDVPGGTDVDPADRSTAS
jgi:hypothetical protein